jgi:hypothetical protein
VKAARRNCSLGDICGGGRQELFSDISIESHKKYAAFDLRRASGDEAMSSRSGGEASQINRGSGFGRRPLWDFPQDPLFACCMMRETLLSRSLRGIHEKGYVLMLFCFDRAGTAFLAFTVDNRRL